MRSSTLTLPAVAALLLAATLLLPLPARSGTTVYRCPGEDGVTIYTNLFDDPECKAMIGDEPPPRPYGDPRSRPYEDALAKAADDYGVDRNLLRAVIKCESNFNHLAISRAGAQGLMQLMPETARLVKVGNPFDAAENIAGGTRYLKYLLDKFGDTRLALAAYNAGEGAVRRHGGIPPYEETRNYVDAVQRQYDRYCTFGTGGDTITSADIESFIDSEGTRLFTNRPWKYRKAADWSHVEAP